LLRYRVRLGVMGLVSPLWRIVQSLLRLFLRFVKTVINR
jgi:hypothetical protein